MISLKIITTNSEHKLKYWTEKKLSNSLECAISNKMWPKKIGNSGCYESDHPKQRKKFCNNSIQAFHRYIQCVCSRFRNGETKQKNTQKNIQGTPLKFFFARNSIPGQQR